MNEDNNIKVVQGAYASFNRGDIAAIVNATTADVEWVIPGEGVIPPAGRYNGRNGVAQFFQILGETSEFFEVQPREYVAQGDRVIALGWYKGKVKETGRTFEADWAMSFTMRDGKIAKFREFTDTAAIAVAHEGTPVAAFHRSI